MKKKEFLKRLEKGLKKLPSTERKDAVRYYDELILDMVEQGTRESEAVRILGSPEDAALRVLSGEDYSRQAGTPYTPRYTPQYAPQTQYAPPPQPFVQQNYGQYYGSQTAPQAAPQAPSYTPPQYAPAPPYVQPRSRRQAEKSGKRSLWIWLLAFFPFTIAFAAIIFSAVITLFALGIALVAIEIALFASFIGGLAYAIFVFVLSGNVPISLAFFAAACVLTGIAFILIPYVKKGLVLCFKAAVKIPALVFKGIGRR